MPVKLDSIPPPIVAPSTPRAWRWLLLLAVLLLFGLGLTLWLAGDTLTHQPGRFWLIALGAPFLIWCGLSLIRAVFYLGTCAVTDGWNGAREADLARKTRQGRRSQQVLAVSVHTALREVGAENGEAQLDALRNGNKALRVQPGWQVSEEGFRHSRLPYEQGESPEMLLRRVLRRVLADIAKVLEKLPEDQPLAQLLDINTSVPKEELNKLWLEVWSESCIRQTATPVEGSGLSAVDSWLDHRIHDQALLLVVASQVAPIDVEDTAEAAVGLLFGNRLTQSTLEPLAYLHRPEAEREPTPEGLLHATRQALDWVPVEASSIQNAWVAGADSLRTEAITSVLNEASVLAKHKQGVHDLGVFLGNPGCAAPWVAIAAAVESIRVEGEAHCIFSKNSDGDERLWCSVVMPPSANSENI
ncbi:hypothetical protein PS870_05944 [Pseudomonas fluorescens]|uniref:Uncharacterized protein n=1 Tax=Pseudomonas fluorescens TaxID=294 RepID=A0A5E7Q9S2_PSEFL|nr:hypothetical protein [Pseudomonas fluorescens]VVP58962.1 hypothetical protein PS870_05944 [Pseudomonas fluorescens]